MKKAVLFNSVKRTLTVAVLVAFLGLFTQCKKALEGLVNPTSTITFYNPTATVVDITVNGEAKIIPVGGSVVYTGTANESAVGNGYTAGKTSSGSLLGVPINFSWTSLYFPSGGSNLDYRLDIPSTYFFLNLKNTSTKNIQKVFVNYGYANQSTENILIPNDGLTYTIGYYLAFTNSNVRVESASTYWYWASLGLSFTNNQQVTLTAN